MRELLITERTAVTPSYTENSWTPVSLHQEARPATCKNAWKIPRKCHEICPEKEGQWERKLGSTGAMPYSNLIIRWAMPIALGVRRAVPSPQPLHNSGSSQAPGWSENSGLSYSRWLFYGLHNEALHGQPGALASPEKWDRKGRPDFHQDRPAPPFCVAPLQIATAPSGVMAGQFLLPF